MEWRRDAKAPERPPAAPTPTRLRAEALSHAAELAKRGADHFLDHESTRARATAAGVAASGLIGLGLALTVALGYGNPFVLSVLAALGGVAPTALAVSRAWEKDLAVRDAATERGLCGGTALQARRLGEAVAATDERGLPLGPEPLVNGQLDALFRELDRSRQRLAEAGVEVGPVLPAERAGERLVPDHVDTVVIAADGRRYPVRIADLSLSAVTLRGNLPPLKLDDLIQVGARKARLGGIIANRATFRFVTPIALSEFNPRIVL